ncbi:hypothetical protein AB0H76_34545 [Nocardia sp. NPDC050712]|uniref:hypothetical protein n=1 Tax=Nocardia sp. NPDC050712 TaxID=3155518 RepID=UPI0033E864C1
MRRQPEDHQAADEQPPAPEDITRAPTQEQKSAEGQRVDVHDPRQIALGKRYVTAAARDTYERGLRALVAGLLTPPARE